MRLKEIKKGGFWSKVLKIFISLLILEGVLGVKMYEVKDPEFVALVEGGIPLANLEQRLRPGNSSQVGFMGQDESLIEVVHSDWQIVEKYGITHKEIADKLKELIVKSSEKKSFLAKLFSRNGSLLAESYDYLPARMLTMGSQSCPWGCRGVSGQNSGYIIRKELSEELKVGVELLVASDGDVAKFEETAKSIAEIAPNSPGAKGMREAVEEIRQALENGLTYTIITRLLPHLIEEHHFFEGKQSPYRADPELLIKALNLEK